MKKALLLLLLIAPFAKAQITNPAPYCGHDYDGGTTPQTHYISKVTIGSFVNNTGTTPWPFPGYVFYNNLTAIHVSWNQTYSYSVEIDGNGANRYLDIWVDWNVNGVFESFEHYGHGPIPASMATVTGAITVPATASSASTRMRISLSEDAALPLGNSACYNTIDWGETEDYQVQVGITSDIASYEKLSVELFPSPVNDQLTVKSGEEIQSLIIYNAAGQKVFERQFNGEKQIAVSLIELPSGTYNASVQSGDQIIVKLFVRE